MLAIEFGTRAGLLAAAVGVRAGAGVERDQHVHVDALGYVSRGAAFVITGVVVGRFSDRLRSDIAERQEAQRDLALYADQLEASNRGLARSVERLEAFAEIARAVGGETELERVLSLILAHGREIVGRPHAGGLPARGRRARGGERQRDALGFAATAAARTARSPARCC